MAGFYELIFMIVRVFPRKPPLIVTDPVRAYPPVANVARRNQVGTEATERSPHRTTSISSIG